MRRSREYVRAMLEAIDYAASETALFKGTTRTNGLRCVRTFEDVNGFEFNPFDKSHVEHIRGMAVHEAIHRRLKIGKSPQTTATDRGSKR